MIVVVEVRVVQPSRPMPGLAGVSVISVLKLVLSRSADPLSLSPVDRSVLLLPCSERVERARVERVEDSRAMEVLCTLPRKLSRKLPRTLPRTRISDARRASR